MFNKFFFFSSFIFSLILCEHSYTIINDSPIEHKLNESNKLSISVHYNGSKKYISLKAQSDKFFPYILFCKKKNCDKRSDAYLVSDRLTETQYLYVEKSDLINYNAFFLIYTKEDKFIGKIKIETSDNIIIPRDASYSFFVEKTDFSNSFEIPRLNNENQDENAVMTFSINTPFKCDFSCKYKTKDGESVLEEIFDFEQGYIITFKEPELKNEAKYICDVKNKEPNNFIIFTSKKYIGTSTTRFYNFYPNSKAIEGILKSGLLNEECFMAIPPKRIEEKSSFALSLTLFTGKAHISLRNSANQTTMVYKLNSYNNEFRIEYEKLYDQNTYFCVTKDENYLRHVIYSLQLIDLFSDFKRADFYSPQMHNLFYQRQTPGKKVVFFYHTKRSNKNDVYTHYYLRVIRGFVDVYIHTCEDFPNCKYDIDNVDKIKNSYNVFNVNNIYYGKFLSSIEQSPISSNQNLFIVACKSNRSCIYETLIYNSHDEIRLKPFIRFSKYSIAKEIDIFKFKIDENDIEKVIVSLYCDSGDVKLSHLPQTENTNYKMKTNFLINKQEIIYSSLQSFIYEFKVMVSSIKNSFYSIEYRIFKKGNNTVSLFQGASFLETIYNDEEGTKSIYIRHNPRNRPNACFQTFFYGLNCKFSIERETYNSSTKEITNNNYFGIDIISNHTETIDEDYKIKLLKYKVKLESMDDIEQYDNIPCMFYVSTLANSYIKELRSSLLYRDRDFLISENIIYNIKLNKKNKGMRFVYPNTNNNQYIFIQFNKEDKEEISVVILCNKIIINKGIIISYSRMITLEKNIISGICNPNELCKILIDITSNDDIKDLEINFSFNLKTESQTPIYVKKGLMKIDSIPGNSLMFYYTDIGKREEGEVIVNFDRGYGNIYGKLVDKTFIDKKNGDWMGFITFPRKNDSDLLDFENDAKKIVYTSKNTEICNNSCFLLITVINPVDSYFKTKILYDISLIFRSINEDLYEDQYIEIMFDKFIVGKLFAAYKKELYHYYNFKIPNDTDKILIEQQNDICDIFVKKGISIEGKNKKYSPTGINNIYEISGEKYKKGDYFSLKIGLNVNQNYFKTVYIFRVRVPEKEIDLIPVNSDQNTLCKYIDFKKMCYYVIFNHGNKKKFYIHAYQSNLSSKITLYISKISEKLINDNDIEKIKNFLPTEKSKNSEKNLRTDTYIDNIDPSEYILVGVNSNKLGIITLLSTFQKELNSLNVDSSAYQLIYLEQNDNINLNFPQNDVFMIKFISIEGSGIIKIKNLKEQFELKSNNDFFVAITSLSDPISIETNYNLGFYVYYEFRGDFNFEEIEFGRSGHFYYSDSQFFLTYYCKIPETIEDIDIVFTIKNYYINEEKNETNIINNKFFKIKGMIIEYDQILEKRKQPKITPKNKTIEGEFEPSLNIMKLKFNKTFIEKAKKGNNYFYITLEKSENINIEYSTILTEYTVFPSKIKENVAPYNQYYFGNLTNENNARAKFILKKNSLEDLFMKIEFATNNDKIQLDISETNFEDGVIKNKIDFTINEKHGKKIGILSIKENINEVYLYVYSKSNPGPNQFTFKYLTSTSKNHFYEFSFNGDIKCNKIGNENKLELTVGKVKFAGNDIIISKLIPVTYYISVIPHKDIKKRNPKIISLLNENITKVYKKYTNGENDQISIILNNFPTDKKYDIIINAIIHEPVFEILYYNYIENPYKYRSPSSNYILIALILIIIAILIVIIIKYLRMKGEKDDYKKQIDQLSLAFGTNADNQLNNNEPEIGFNKLKN